MLGFCLRIIVQREVVPRRMAGEILVEIAHVTLLRLAMTGSLSLGRLRGQQPLLLLRALIHPIRQLKTEPHSLSNRQSSVWPNGLQLLA